MALQNLNPDVMIGPENIQLASTRLIPAGQQPTDARVAAEIMHFHTVEKLKEMDGNGVKTVSDADLAESGRNVHRVLDAASINHGSMLTTILATLDEFTQKFDNMRAIQWNGRAHNLDASLMPLAVQNSGGQQALGMKLPIMGAQGGIFPANVAQLNALRAQDITALQDVYNDTFGIIEDDTVANRVSKFRYFIGA